MKKLPYPDKVLKTDEDIREYCEELVFNTMQWLRLAGYLFFIVLPGEDNHKADDLYGMSISVEYPYKKFFISVQKNSIDKMRNAPVKSPVFVNTERSIFHEMFHVLTWQVTELARRRYTTPTAIEDADEYLVDHLANLVHDLVEQIRKSKNKK